MGDVGTWACTAKTVQLFTQAVEIDGAGAANGWSSKPIWVPGQLQVLPDAMHQQRTGSTRPSTSAGPFNLHGSHGSLIFSPLNRRVKRRGSAPASP